MDLPIICIITIMACTISFFHVIKSAVPQHFPLPTKYCQHRVTNTLSVEVLPPNHGEQSLFRSGYKHYGKVLWINTEHLAIFGVAGAVYPQIV